MSWLKIPFVSLCYYVFVKRSHGRDLRIPLIYFSRITSRKVLCKIIIDTISLLTPKEVSRLCDSFSLLIPPTKNDRAHFPISAYEDNTLYQAYGFSCTLFSTWLYWPANGKQLDTPEDTSNAQSKPIVKIKYVKLII